MFARNRNKGDKPILRSLSSFFRRGSALSDTSSSSAPDDLGPAKAERVPTPPFLVKGRRTPVIPASKSELSLPIRNTTSPEPLSSSAYVCSFKECWSPYCPTHNPSGGSRSAPQSVRTRTRTVSTVDTIRTPSTATSSETSGRTPSLVTSSDSSLSRNSSRRFECYASRCEASNCPEHGRAARANKRQDSYSHSQSQRPLSAPPSPTDVIFLPRAMWTLPGGSAAAEHGIQASKLIYLEKPAPLKVVKRSQSSQSLLAPRRSKTHSRKHGERPEGDWRETELEARARAVADGWRGESASSPAEVIGIAL